MHRFRSWLNSEKTKDTRTVLNHRIHLPIVLVACRQRQEIVTTHTSLHQDQLGWILVVTCNCLTRVSLVITHLTSWWRYSPIKSCYNLVTVPFNLAKNLPRRPVVSQDVESAAGGIRGCRQRDYCWRQGSTYTSPSLIRQSWIRNESPESIRKTYQKPITPTKAC